MNPEVAGKVAEYRELRKIVAEAAANQRLGQDAQFAYARLERVKIEAMRLFALHYLETDWTVGA